jgi:hypothetical protein
MANIFDQFDPAPAASREKRASADTAAPNDDTDANRDLAALSGQPEPGPMGKPAATASRLFASQAARQQAEQPASDLGRLVAHLLATSPPGQVLQFLKRFGASENEPAGERPASSSAPYP